MAKVNIEYDTESKKIKCMLDDKEVAFHSAEFYCNDDEKGQMRIGLAIEEKEGMAKFSSLIASTKKNWFGNIFGK